MPSNRLCRFSPSLWPSWRRFPLENAKTTLSSRAAISQIPFPESKFRVQAGCFPFVRLPRLAWTPEYGPCPPPLSFSFFLSFLLDVHSQQAGLVGACLSQLCWVEPGGHQQKKKKKKKERERRRLGN
ncbi:hypothetical protein LZ31DRAFT_113862 [Colletotrichum somersetense]|nr:hypothetical protein LZ31DRAFT_113862 [Colletotrichum somersetense]